MSTTGPCRQFLEKTKIWVSSVQFSRSVVSDSLRPMNRSTPGLPVHHQLPALANRRPQRPEGITVGPSHLQVLHQWLQTTVDQNI